MKYFCDFCDEENPCILMFKDVGEEEDIRVPTVCPFISPKVDRIQYCRWIRVMIEDYK